MTNDRSRRGTAADSRVEPAEDDLSAGARLRLFWDEGAGPLWSDEGLLPDEPDWLKRALGLSDELVGELLGWMKDMDTARTLGQAPRSLALHAKRLAGRLQSEVGDRFKVERYR